MNPTPQPPFTPPPQPGRNMLRVVFALAFTFGSTVSLHAQSLQVRLQQMTASYSHFSLPVIVNQQPLYLGNTPRDHQLNAEQMHLLDDLRAASSNLAELQPLLNDPDPKIRTLALGAILQREDGRDLPLIASLLADPAPTFLDLHMSFNSQGGERPLSEIENPQTVGHVAQAMLELWGVPHGISFPVTAQNFSAYWKNYAGRTWSANWFIFKMKRATRTITPIQPQFSPEIQRVLNQMKALPQPGRSLTELYVLSADWFWFHPAEDNPVANSYILAEAQQLGPATLMNFLERTSVSEDPAFLLGDRDNSASAFNSQNGRLNHMADFILRHADQLLRPEDAPALLACQDDERATGRVDAAWAIAAALVQPTRAGDVLHSALAHVTTTTDYNNAAQLAGALWRIRGPAELSFLTGWFYSAQSGRGAPFPPPDVFLWEVEAADRPDTPQLLAALVSDPRFGQTGRRALTTMVKITNAHRTTPLSVPSDNSWPSLFPDRDATLGQWRDLLRQQYGVATKTAPTTF